MSETNRAPTHRSAPTQRMSESISQMSEQMVHNKIQQLSHSITNITSLKKLQ